MGCGCDGGVSVRGWGRERGFGEGRGIWGIGRGVSGAGLVEGTSSSSSKMPFLPPSESYAEGFLGPSVLCCYAGLWKPYRQFDRDGPSATCILQWSSARDHGTTIRCDSIYHTPKWSKMCSYLSHRPCPRWSGTGWLWHVGPLMLIWSRGTCWYFQWLRPFR